MKLGKYPERNKTVTDTNLFKERENSLPENTRKVKETYKYFADLTHEVDNNLHAEPKKLEDINIDYIDILNDCIKFAENKKVVNEEIQKGLNEKIYNNMTGRYGYDGTVWTAKFMLSAFLDPTINEDIKNNPQVGYHYLTRDAREQAYRICEYVLKYLEGYAEDDRLKKKTKKQLLEVLA